MSPFDPAWADKPGKPGSDYHESVWAAALLAIDPAGLGGILLRAWSGPARESWLRKLQSLFPAAAPLRKMPLHISDDRLLGGLDLAATLSAGRPVLESGLLAAAQGGVLQLAMAERISAGTAARLAAVLDVKADPGTQIAMIALDEGNGPDEAPPSGLAERLAFTIGVLPPEEAAWPTRYQVESARDRLVNVVAGPETIEQICLVAAVSGIASLRAPLFALRAARAAAALRGGAEIEPADVALAIQLILAPRATQAPPAEPEPPPAAEPEEQQAAEPDQKNAEALDDQVIDSAHARLPPELLAALAGGGPRRMVRGAGTAGETISLKRGRPAGVRPGTPGGDARLSIIETLRAAAPWQTLRRSGTMPNRLRIRRDDFRIKKFKEQAQTIAIFAVDASGSSAVNRLAEVKGAIQLLLAECYVRRDQVALIAFRGREATCLLPPTHALARARNCLARLPGGGPTPLSRGIHAARQMAEAERRKGHQPLLVLLTDGGANIGQNGQPGRAAAGADALAAGATCRAGNISALVVDTAPRPQAHVAKLAAAMGARYLPLPIADAAALTRAVKLAA